MKKDKFRIDLLFLLFLILLATSCTMPFSLSTKQTMVTPTAELVMPGKEFPTIMPPAAPLICPANQAGQSQTTFVTERGTQLLYQQVPLKLYGYTFYPATIGGTAAWHNANFPNYIDHILMMGQAVGQNLLRPTDFWNVHDPDNKQNNITVWHNIDYLMCTAKQHDMFVVMDISAFAHWLTSQQLDPYNAENWIAFLRAVGKRYTNQSSIAFYSILGEPTPPKTLTEMNQLVNFYRTVTDELYAADGGHHLITAGGFNHMEDESARIPWWHSIYQLPHNNIVAFKTYSQQDIQLLPTIAAFSRNIKKPAVDEEFGMPQSAGDASYSGEAYNNIKMARSQFYQQVYTLGEKQTIAGFIFWNMGCGLQDHDYEVSPKTPAVWQVLQEHAPNKAVHSELATRFCPIDNFSNLLPKQK